MRGQSSLIIATDAVLKLVSTLELLHYTEFDEEKRLTYSKIVNVDDQIATMRVFRTVNDYQY